jgi:hypothetical protein
MDIIEKFSARADYEHKHVLAEQLKGAVLAIGAISLSAYEVLESRPWTASVAAVILGGNALHKLHEAQIHRKRASKYEEIVLLERQFIVDLE